MECVILVRMPRGPVTGLQNDNGDLMVFPNRDAAIDAALAHPLCRALPYQIVECDEL